MWEIRVAFPGESQLQQSRATDPTLLIDDVRSSFACEDDHDFTMTCECGGDYLINYQPSVCSISIPPTDEHGIFNAGKHKFESVRTTHEGGVRHKHVFTRVDNTENCHLTLFHYGVEPRVFVN